MYNGKNRTPWVKDAFNDHIIPAHRPAEPEPERKTDGGLPTKGSRQNSPVALKTSKLPGGPEADDEEKQDAGETYTNGNGKAADDAENIIQPPPRPTSSSGSRQYVNPEKTGTKAGAHYVFNNVPGKGGCVVVRLKMTPATPEEDPSILDEELFDDTIEDRRVDADEFYGRIAKGSISDDLRNIMRQALSGMLW